MTNSHSGTGAPVPGDRRPRPRGGIIFQNGTSSAGKSTLAGELQRVLPEPWLHIALDQFRDAMPGRYRGLNSPEGTTGADGLNVVPVVEGGAAYTEIRFGDYGKQVLRGMRRAIAALAREGNHVIVDDLLLEESFLIDYLDVLRPFQVLFVGVHCPPETISAREASRLGRFPGTAIGQLGPVHAHRLYDLEIDTAALTPRECADRIAACLAQPPSPSAFEQLYSLHHSSPPR